MTRIRGHSGSAPLNQLQAGRAARTQPENLQYGGMFAHRGIEAKQRFGIATRLALQSVKLAFMHVENTCRAGRVRAFRNHGVLPENYSNCVLKMSGCF